MLKRLRWFLLGFMAGLATFIYLRDKINDLKEQYAAVRGTATAISALRGIRRDVRDAWADGRNKIRSTEQRIRAQASQHRSGEHRSNNHRAPSTTVH